MSSSKDESNVDVGEKTSNTRSDTVLHRSLDFTNDMKQSTAFEKTLIAMPTASLVTTVPPGFEPIRNELGTLSKRFFPKSSGWEETKAKHCEYHPNEIMHFECSQCNAQCCIRCAMQIHFNHQYIYPLVSTFQNKDINGWLSKEVDKCANDLLLLRQMEANVKSQILTEFAKMEYAIAWRKEKLMQKIEERCCIRKSNLKEKMFSCLTSLAAEKKYRVNVPGNIEVAFSATDSRKLISMIQQFGELSSNGFGKNCTAFGHDARSAVLKEPFRFQVQVRDCLGSIVKKGDDEVMVNILRPKMIESYLKSSSYARIIDCWNGKYIVCCYFHEVGEFFVMITVNGKEIQGSPFKISVNRGNNLTNIKTAKKVIKYVNEANSPYTVNGIRTEMNKDVSNIPRGSLDSGIGVEVEQIKPAESELLFCRPWGICCSPCGFVFVADRSNHNLKMFDENYRFLFSIGSRGTGAGEFDLPSGLAVDSKLNRLVVCDKDNHRIQIFDLKVIIGAIAKKTRGCNLNIKPILLFGQQGTETGEFHYPWDCAVGKNSEIVVSDTKNNRLQLFTKDGAYMCQKGIDLSKRRFFEFPRGVAFSPSNHIIVSDFNNHRILILNNNLNIEKWFGYEGSALGELRRPQGVAVDDFGNIIVADSRNSRIQIFAPNGRALHSFGTIGNGIQGTEMDRPAGVCVSPKGEILVVDFGNDRILVF